MGHPPLCYTYTDIPMAVNNILCNPAEAKMSMRNEDNEFGLRFFRQSYNILSTIQRLTVDTKQALK